MLSTDRIVLIVFPPKGDFPTEVKKKQEVFDVQSLISYLADALKPIKSDGNSEGFDGTSMLPPMATDSPSDRADDEEGESLACEKQEEDDDNEEEESHSTTLLENVKLVTVDRALEALIELTEIEVAVSLRALGHLFKRFADILSTRKILGSEV